jgi:hypothetical protein
MMEYRRVGPLVFNVNIETSKLVCLGFLDTMTLGEWIEFWLDDRFQDILRLATWMR